MIADVLNARIREYAPASALEQENVLQELMQHYVLASLSRAGMFSEAIFHGGTCLRIIHGMSRFSEDLDFLLKWPDPGFRWKKYLEAVDRDCAQEGIEFVLQDKSAADNAVQKAFLKTDSIGKVLLLAFPFDRPNPRKIRIKLEIDTNSGPRLTPCYAEDTSKAATGMTSCGTPPGKSSPTSSFCKTRCCSRGRGRDGLWK